MDSNIQPFWPIHNSATSKIASIQSLKPTVPTKSYSVPKGATVVSDLAKKLTVWPVLKNIFCKHLILIQTFKIV